MTQYVYLALTALTSFIISLLIGPHIIKILHQLKFGQSIRDDGPQSHQKKAGTPTMGGVLILISMISGLLVTRQFSTEVLWLVFLTLSYGLIGFIDDIIIIMTKKSLGLKARQKLFAQIVIAAIAGFFLIQNPNFYLQIVPFANNQLILLKPLFFIYAVFVLVATSNAVNLTDGLDGLAAGTTAIALVAMGILCMFLKLFDLAIFAFALAGACFGFIWFNGPPAQVFMGDTGSLALGAALGGLALFSRTSLFLIIIGGVFVAEALSVIIQVLSFKFTGKRVFRMSPLHHHFELGGMLEPQIVMRFWMVGVILGIIGIIGFIIG
ncbi:MAG TPA: phospho-N-acetylmuramoyl-pentapeptide-transferase [Bacillota bacterium]|nr:phospho-N-acetylmuramoyl-pentapeptide-transferase [Bacillota bacterium]HOL08536.1 phospho-N-acetylmuramoyl-pentapeptide-transferase [Bacillota bacterium]HPO96983.1 phospho-N-acetylmuramoyl-pentapeptide-transferase [Bacillota bacterium]